MMVSAYWLLWPFILIIGVLVGGSLYLFAVCIIQVFVFLFALNMWGEEEAWRLIVAISRENNE